MLAKLLVTMAALLALLAGWVLVQAAGRRQARRHPETGPYREVGCSGHCGGCGLPCETEAPARLPAVQELR